MYRTRAFREIGRFSFLFIRVRRRASPKLNKKVGRMTNPNCMHIWFGFVEKKFGNLGYYAYICGVKKNNGYGKQSFTRVYRMG